MIAPHVLDRLELLRAAFQSARPFKHLCIDDFLEPDSAEALLRDFPVFDPERARNEFGEIGGKAAHTKLEAISPFYARMYRWLLSRDFLDAMERLTGIPDLIADPTMFGGGTHENRDGQSLDPHVDFNYSLDNKTHRRANLLIYLNQNWREEWGGAIELHSNPRDPDRNDITAFNVIFNRAVIFETNEISWHGFPRICLPPSEAGNSRKCLSVYLYTRTRPPQEIAGRHSTFYVQRPLARDFVAGYTLRDDDVAALKVAIRRRDELITFHQTREERLGRTIDELHTMVRSLEGQVDELRATPQLPLVGFALLQRISDGIRYPDGWATARLAIAFEARRPLTRIALTAQILEQMPAVTRRFTLSVGGQAADHVVETAGQHVLDLPVTIAADARFTLTITCNESFSPAKLGFGADDRELAYLLAFLVIE